MSMSRAELVRAELSRRVRAQVPSQPPMGPLDVVARLLVARAAPFDTSVQACLLARWGLEQVNDGQRAVCRDRVRSASVRMRTIALTTGPPDALVKAMEVVTAYPAAESSEGVLRGRGLAERGGWALVDGLRRLYDLDWPHERAYADLEPSARLVLGEQVASTLRRGAVRCLDDEAKKMGLAVWLRSRRVLATGNWMLALDDVDSVLALLVRRQLAAAGQATAQDLVKGLHRSGERRRLLAQLDEVTFLAWSRLQPWLAVTGDALRPVDPSWARSAMTASDKLLVDLLGSGPRDSSGLVTDMVAAGRWTAPSAKVALAVSPVVRRQARGRYGLLGQVDGPSRE